ncbi:MAG: hypothetical protein HY678_12565 [Chloroflexi bacterium]|nr:hypothetical protein [Chloroflexota bacterium]
MHYEDVVLASERIFHRLHEYRALSRVVDMGRLALLDVLPIHLPAAFLHEPQERPLLGVETVARYLLFCADPS